MKKRQLHVSGLNKLSACGEAFRRQYIEKEKSPPSIPMIVGIATHATVKQNLTKKKDTGNLMLMEEVLDVARDELGREWDKDGVLETDEDVVVYGEKKAKAMAVDKAVRLSGLHRHIVAPQVQNPTHLEREWVLDIEGFQFELAGAIDVQELVDQVKLHVRDTKTSGKSPSADVADKSLQLSMYAMALWKFEGKLPESLTLDYLIDNKMPIVKSFSTKRVIADFQPLMRRVEAATAQIESGIFQPANPDHWLCSAKYCHFWSTCKYAMRPVSISLVNIDVPTI